MTLHSLRDHLTAYAAGVDVQIALLERVRRLALDQRAAAEADASDRLSAATDERSQVMADLERLEQDIQPSRLALAERQADAAALDGFDAVVALHRTAEALVVEIMVADQDTVQALARADAARRQRTHQIDAGETTLAAYQRVLVAPADSGPALVDRRG